MITTWSGKRTLLTPGWVTLYWLHQINAICRLYAMTLSRYEVGFEVSPKLFRVSSFYPWNLLISNKTNIFKPYILFQSSYQSKLTFSENFYQIIQSSYKPTLIFFRELLSNYNTFSWGMHVYITILLGLNQPTTFAANLLQSRGGSRNHTTSLQQLRAAKSR